MFENNEMKNRSQIVFEFLIIQVYYCFSKAVARDFHSTSYNKYCQNARQTTRSIIVLVYLLVFHLV